MKNIKNLKIRIAALALAATCSFAALPTVAYATETEGEEILYEETEDNYTQEDITEVVVPEGTTYEEVHPEENQSTKTQPEETQPTETQQPTETKRDNGPDEFIDADNWSPETDVDPNAGLVIPDYVQTEWERKHPTNNTPTDNPPKDDKPTDNDKPKDDKPTDNDKPKDDKPTDDDKPKDDTPTDDDKPKDDTPVTSIPKTADGYTRFLLGGGALTGVLFGLKKILETVKCSYDFIKTTDGVEISSDAKKVIASKKKSQIKSKKLK